jgi:AraC-like DNA-binding protein
MRILYSDKILVDNLHIRLFLAERMIVDPVWWTGRLQDVFWRLYRNGENGGSLLLEDQSYLLYQDQFYFVPAGVRFKCQCTHELEHFYVHFDITGIPRIILQNLFNMPIRVPDSEALNAMFGVLLDEFVASGSTRLATQLRIKGLIYEALALCLDAVPVERLERTKLDAEALEIMRPALEHIDQHLSSTITVTELAARCNMSKDYFIRRFRQTVGTTPSQYILQQRVRYSSQELLYTSKTIEQIATEAGFGNRYYFTRAFSKSMGVSPARYRKGRLHGIRQEEELLPAFMQATG